MTPNRSTPAMRWNEAFGSPAEKLHDQLAHVLNRGVRIEMIDAALREQTRITVERVRERLDSYQPTKPGWVYWHKVFLSMLNDEAGGTLVCDCGRPECRVGPALNALSHEERHDR